MRDNIIQALKRENKEKEKIAAEQEREGNRTDRVQSLLVRNHDDTTVYTKDALTYEQLAEAERQFGVNQRIDPRIVTMSTPTQMRSPFDTTEDWTSGWTMSDANEEVLRSGGYQEEDVTKSIVDEVAENMQARVDASATAAVYGTPNLSRGTNINRVGQSDFTQEYMLDIDTDLNLT